MDHACCSVSRIRVPKTAVSSGSRAAWSSPRQPVDPCPLPVVHDRASLGEVRPRPQGRHLRTGVGGGARATVGLSPGRWPVRAGLHPGSPVLVAPPSLAPASRRAEAADPPSAPPPDGALPPRHGPHGSRASAPGGVRRRGHGTAGGLRRPYAGGHRGPGALVAPGVVGRGVVALSVDEGELCSVAHHALHPLADSRRGGGNPRGIHRLPCVDGRVPGICASRATNRARRHGRRSNRVGCEWPRWAHAARSWPLAKSVHTWDVSSQRVQLELEVMDPGAGELRRDGRQRQA